jgi:hypothetical protein
MNTRPFSLRGIPGRLLLGLLIVDCLLVGIHLLHSFPASKNAFSLLQHSFFSISEDRGLGELFQYTKQAWIVGCLLLAAAHRKNAFYLGMAALFVFFGLTDSLEIHERLGVVISEHFQLKDVLHLRGTDAGEMLVVGMVGIVFLCWLIPSFLRSPPDVQTHGKRIGLLVVILVLFGVGIDSLHQLSKDLPKLLYYGRSTLEETGEMIVTSFLCWYAFIVAREGREETIESP